MYKRLEAYDELTDFLLDKRMAYEVMVLILNRRCQEYDKRKLVVISEENRDDDRVREMIMHIITKSFKL